MVDLGSIAEHNMLHKQNTRKAYYSTYPNKRLNAYHTLMHCGNLHTMTVQNA